MGILWLFAAWPHLAARTFFIADVAALRACVSAGLQPGDTVRLANGVWKDADLVFKGQGTVAQPIVLLAATAGQVWLEGASSLRLSGQYVEVRDLHFRNGGVTGAVMEYRTSNEDIANHCRITNCVIDDYNSPDRHRESVWIQLYGQHNRLDHCYIGGKKNGGVTLAVNLNEERHRDNYHRIDHNIFGPRPPLGTNGGETIRIGVSTYSLTNSKTVVEDNYFYHCNGEAEIVSIKSGENTIRRNVFYESEGSVVLRHGNRNTIEGNYFIGNGKPHTGGVRVINAGHRVVNNYFENLKGDRFRAALAVMNGVPNSPLNRYHQVQDVVIAFNTFVACDHIALAVGKDNERTAPPLRTTLVANVFLKHAVPVYEAEDDIGGITFRDNLVQTAASSPLPTGFYKAAFKGLLPKHTIGKPMEATFLLSDLEGNSRGEHCHAGAFEQAPRRALSFTPAQRGEVGPAFFEPSWTATVFPPTHRIHAVQALESRVAHHLVRPLPYTRTASPCSALLFTGRGMAWWLGGSMERIKT